VSFRIFFFNITIFCPFTHRAKIYSRKIHFNVHHKALFHVLLLSPLMAAPCSYRRRRARHFIGCFGYFFMCKHHYVNVIAHLVSCGSQSEDSLINFTSREWTRKNWEWNFHSREKKENSPRKKCCDEWMLCTRWKKDFP
jgi:hypothetical protein